MMVAIEAGAPCFAQCGGTINSQADDPIVLVEEGVDVVYHAACLPIDVVLEAIANV